MKMTKPKANETPRDIVDWIRRNVPKWEETREEAERTLILVADRLDASLDREAKKLEPLQDYSPKSMAEVRRVANSINL